MNLKEKMLLRKIENTYGGDFDKIFEFVQYSGESRHIQTLDKLSLATFDIVCRSMEKRFEELPYFNYYEAFVYFAKKNRVSLAAKCFTKFYLSTSCNNTNEIKNALNLYIRQWDLIDAGLYDNIAIDMMYDSYNHRTNYGLEELILNRPQEEIFELYLEKVKFKGKFKNGLDIEILEKLYDIETPKKLVLNLSVDDLCWCIDKIQLSKNVKKAYGFYNELISINKPGKVDTHILNNRLIDTIFESDTGKYTYMLLLCHKNKLSNEDVKKFEEKLNSCRDKQYKYFYLFHTKKDEVLKQFENYMVFIMFLKTSGIFSDKEECLLMVEELKNEIDKEEKNNNAKYKDALDAISISTKKIKNV